MNTPAFVGRAQEIKRLKEQHSKHVPSLVVIKGRRRVGKSRLVAEFASQLGNSKLWAFAGLAPQDGMDAQSQKDYFARQLSVLLKIPPLTFLDWADAFDHLFMHLRPGDVVLLDEISWMGDQDPSFIPKLKAWWDQQQLPITLVLCGSISTWIEDNIINSTAFFGRINLTISLQPLSITSANKLLQEVNFQGSTYEIFKLLSILGGIPWYLEQASAGITADENIKRLCFERDGLLVSEFDRIFHDLFHGKGTIYKKILFALMNGMKTLAEIRKDIKFAHSGTLSSLMNDLIVAGFVAKQQLWSFKTTKPLKQSLYRICDPYMRFYLKLIEPARNKIALNGFNDSSIAKLPGFDAHIGLQLESLLLQNRGLLLDALNLTGNDIVADGPYRQSQTTTQNGCQIDYLIQTHTKSLFICEFEFKRREIGIEIIEDMKEKISSLKVPRGYATIPVLLHIGGVSSNVATSNYFYRIIDINDFL